MNADVMAALAMVVGFLLALVLVTASFRIRERIRTEHALDQWAESTLQRRREQALPVGLWQAADSNAGRSLVLVRRTADHSDDEIKWDV